MTSAIDLSMCNPTSLRSPKLPTSLRRLDSATLRRTSRRIRRPRSISALTALIGCNANGLVYAPGSHHMRD